MKNNKITIPVLDKEHSNISAELYEKKRKIFCTFAELSRQLRADLIHAFWYFSNNQLIICTKSLRSPDTIQKSFFSSTDDNLHSNSSIQLKNYDDILSELDTGITIHIE